jgi:hypothetical protein
MCSAVILGQDHPSTLHHSHPSKSDHDYRALNEREVNELEESRELAGELLRERLGIFSLPILRADLQALQELVDDAEMNPLRREEWAAVGIVFGDVIASELEMEWCAFISPHAIELAIATADFRLTLFPRRILLRQIEEGGRVELDALLEQLSEHADKLQARSPSALMY